MKRSGDPTQVPRDERDRALARLEKALGEALTRNDAAERLLEDQRRRLTALGAGREETMRALAEARAELRRVSQERDDLRKQLARIDELQATTIALPDDEPAPAPLPDVPSLEDLMSALGQMDERRGAGGLLHQRVPREHDSDRSEEMISPQLVFPEQYAETAEFASQNDAAVSRVLVLLDAERPIKYPLYKEIMTIGRADIADIRIDNDFLSRLHARIVSTPDGVTIEDIESKNGLRVNTKLTPRHSLSHGDVVDLGRLRFRFIDAAADDAD